MEPAASPHAQQGRPQEAITAAPAITSATIQDMDWAQDAARQAGCDPTRGIATVFCPSTTALMKYAQADPQAALELSTPCGYSAVAAHTIPHVALSVADIPEGTTAYASGTGTPLAVTKDSHNNVTVASSHQGQSFPATVIASNIAHGDALVHIIDTVLHPVAQLEEFS